MSTFEVLNKTICVQLMVTLWTPWRRLDDEDLGGSSGHPPSDLATKGSIKVCDGARIAQLSTIKRNAERDCADQCTRFLGGFATKEDRIGSLVTKLDAHQAAFAAAAASFVSLLPDDIDDWAQKHAAWESVIRRKAPDAIRDAHHVKFSYQLFRVTPADQDDPHASVNSGLANAAQGLAGQLFREIETSAREALKRTFQGRSEVTRKALRPIRHMRDKLQTLSYLDPRCDSIIDRINRVLQSMPKLGPIANEHLSALIGLLHVLGDAEALQAHVPAAGSVGASGSSDPGDPEDADEPDGQADPHEAEIDPPSNSSTPSVPPPVREGSHDALWF